MMSHQFLVDFNRQQTVSNGVNCLLYRIGTGTATTIYYSNNINNNNT